MLRRRIVVVALLALSHVAEAQQIKSRVMVLLDTSGSMGFHFKDPSPFCDPATVVNGNCPNSASPPDFAGGDGSTLYTDGVVANQVWFPGKVVGNARDGVNTRLFAAKSALNDAITAYSGNVDFGLTTYDFQMCPFANPLCAACVMMNQANGIQYNCLYTDSGFTKLVSTNWESEGCAGPGKGGRIIVTPATGSSSKILPWIDGVEVFKDSADGVNTWGTGGGTPVNPELRASGDTPLAETIAVVKTQWYDAVKGGDAQAACRPYVLVVETDGTQSYEGNGVGQCGADPVAAAQALYNDGQALGNPVLTYVIGLSIDQQDAAAVNNIAIGGGTMQAHFANNQTDIEAAYADILAASVKVELCNGKDDNCNGLIDEGLGVYQECTVNNQCTSGTCNAGRCVCNGDAQCANGSVCGGGFCVPSCATGVGACGRSGVKKCGMQNAAACCVDDGQPSCSPLTAGAPGALICKPGVDNNCNGILDVNEPGCANNICDNPVPETCNGKDDDCDGIIDDNLVDTGKPCGLNVGQCKPGTTTCVNSLMKDVSILGNTPDAMDMIICVGAVAKKGPMCNGCDNDCDGNIDVTTQTCYDGPMGTDGVGQCHRGLQRCNANMCPQAPSFGPCTGEVVPAQEICNGLDDDCNGIVDDVAGVGKACCPSGLCGKGICTPGMVMCSGGMLACVGGQGPRPEICNGLDDDCNGVVDDLPNIGKACGAANGCAGTFTCDLVKMMEVCTPSQMNCMPAGCGADPRLGMPCGPGMGKPVPCMAGIYKCENNQVVCSGGVGPTVEICNCVDDDCNGVVDDNAYCPGGTACVSCQCVSACARNEFPCDFGYDCIDPPKPCTADADCGGPGQVDQTCDPNSKQCGPGYCVPSGDCKPACQPGFDCLGGMCVDRCESITCPRGFVCQMGDCVDNTCRGVPTLCKACGGGSGERCDLSQDPPACVEDKCCGNNCNPAKQFCEPSTGACVNTCAGVSCPSGQHCVDGACMPFRCAGVQCPEGQTCNPASGMCQDDPCLAISCVPGYLCCDGTCEADTCSLVACPDGTRCSTNSFDCSHSCDPGPAAVHDEVVGLGGSGLSCAVAGVGRASSSSSSSERFGAWLLVLGFASLVLRRRGRTVVLALAFATLAAGCNANPFCLDCYDGGMQDSGPTNLGDLYGSPDFTLVSGLDLSGGDGQCSPDVMSDPKNCGACGHECTFAHAGGQCAKGMCSIGQCNQGYYDVNHDPSDGCEYACSPTPPAQCKVDQDCSFALPCNNGQCIKTCAANADCPASTICDPDTLLCEGDVCDGLDNNCNGVIDEGFNKQTDVNNCGSCGAVCNPPNAVAVCAAGVCGIASCNSDGMGGKFYDLDKIVANGCEYDCSIASPGPEICNGLDDDCDGIIDDNLTDVGMPCDEFCPMPDPCVALKNCKYPLSVCHGSCCGVCTEGTTFCSAGVKVCQAGMGNSLEVCNGVDDNCDGQIDEGFNLKLDALNCGACGNVCSPPNAIGSCFNGVCGIATCAPGFADVDKNPANGCEYACPINPPTVESCNGADDDCDGIVDDNLVQPNNFCVQQSACAGAKPVCCGATGWLCNYPSINGKIEVTNTTMCQGGQVAGTLVFAEKLCDGFDGNCNGSIDESFTNLGKACTVGVGACQGQGKFICDPNNPMQTTCPAVANPMAAVDEICNGIDDDCDGQVDERTPAQGSLCYNVKQHACLGVVEPMVQSGSVWVHQYEASHLDATANAAGNALGRACSRAGVLPWAPVTQPAAAAACALISDSQGKPMRLCTAAEWSTACDLGGKATWSYASNANVYQAMICNGADANVNKAWPEGTGAQCYAAVAQGQDIYDMSGNVAEWTSTTVLFNGTTYFKARGGAYDSAGGSLKCDFDFVIETGSYQYNDIGFRCCADNAP